MNVAGFSVREIDIQVADSVGIVVVLVVHHFALAGLERPLFVPMKTYRGLSQLRDYFLARHARLDGKEILVGQNFLIPAGKLTTPLSLVGSQCGMGGEKNQRQQRQDVDPQSASRKQRLLYFQMDDVPDLCPPELGHRTTSSLPIRYS